MDAPRDTTADARRRKRERKAARRDKAYSAWLHTQPCCVCGRYGIEQHHEPPRSHRGWHDHKSVPLCAEHHRGKDGRHTLGYPRFCERHGVDLHAEAARLWGEFVG